MKQTYVSPDISVCFLNGQDVVRTSLPIEDNSDGLNLKGDYSREWF